MNLNEIIVYRADTLNQSIYVIDENENEQTPKDLTGYTATFIVKKINSDYNDKALITKNIEIEVAIDGYAILQLDENDTNIPPGIYEYWIKITKIEDGNVLDKKTILNDKFIVKYGINKD